jgi:pimeloyl-ACP methyl ester carboxylesterase
MNKPRTLRRRDFCISAAAALGGAGWLTHELLAQPGAPKPPAGAPKPAPRAPATRAPATRPPAAPAKKPDPKKEPRSITLNTKDGVALRAEFFPGGKGKETVPIILLHGWEERGAVWTPLATYFQRVLGHAVIVPDLRGHGQSLTQNVPGMTEPRTLSPDDLTPADMEATVLDVQECKKYLQEENNKGELNLEMLCIIGAKYGAMIGMKFAALDWSWPILTTGKQGQDVKGLALLTPIDRMKRVTAAPALQALRVPIASGRFSMLVMAGEQDRTGFADAKRMHRQLEAMYPKGQDEKPQAEQGLWMVAPDTNSHGTQLIDPARRLGMERALTDFIAQRIIARKDDFEWTERKSALAR